MKEITISIIGALGVVLAATLPIVIGLRKARKENREQHNDNRGALEALTGQVSVMHLEVRDMRKDFTRHLEEHER